MSLAPERVDFTTAAARRAALPRVVAHLKEGGLIAYPTETVYGFGCALRPAALARLQRLKRRGAAKPFLLLVHDIARVADLEWTGAASALADAFWPGPLTLALLASRGTVAGRPVPTAVAGPGGTVAVRACAHAGARELLAALDEPLTSTSANAPGAPPARNAAAALAAAIALERSEAASGVVGPADAGKLDPNPVDLDRDAAGEPPGGGGFLVLDGGRLPVSPPSTLVECLPTRTFVLREGALPLAALRSVVPDVDGPDGG